MKRKLSEPNDRVLTRLIVALVTAVGLNLAGATRAQAAGNVELKLENGDVIVTGDDADNNIIVIQGCCEKVIVAGRAETTINGSGGRFDVEGATHEVVIKMKGGDDFVRVEQVGGSPGFPNDLKIIAGKGDDIIELLGVTVQDETEIDTGDGNDIILIDGVREPNSFKKGNFKGKFALEAGDGQDLFEFHHAIFRSAVDVTMGSGIDGACNTEDSDFLRPDEARFDGGPPSGFPGDGFVAPIIYFTHITNFEDFPDDCAYLGGRD